MDKATARRLWHRQLGSDGASCPSDKECKAFDAGFDAAPSATGTIREQREEEEARKAGEDAAKEAFGDFGKHLTPRSSTVALDDLSRNLIESLSNWLETRSEFPAWQRVMGEREVGLMKEYAHRIRSICTPSAIGASIEEVALRLIEKHLLRVQYNTFGGFWSAEERVRNDGQLPQRGTAPRLCDAVALCVEKLAATDGTVTK